MYSLVDDFQNKLVCAGENHECLWQAYSDTFSNVSGLSIVLFTSL